MFEREPYANNRGYKIIILLWWFTKALPTKNSKPTEYYQVLYIEPSFFLLSFIKKKFTYIIINKYKEGFDLKLERDKTNKKVLLKNFI